MATTARFTTAARFYGNDPPTTTDDETRGIPEPRRRPILLVSVVDRRPRARVGSHRDRVARHLPPAAAAADDDDECGDDERDDGDDDDDDDRPRRLPES
jgi:hypothetical protein